jgi:osmotically inducible lipoprotein OsmB
MIRTNPSSGSRRVALPAVVVAALALGACSNMNSTQQRTLSGGAIGAGAGAAGAALTGGCVICGTAIGGAVGAGAGYLYDQSKKDSH